MSEQIVSRHGLESLLMARAGTPVKDPGVSLRVLGSIPAVNLRGDPQSDAFRHAVSGVLGHDLPSRPNTFVAGEPCIYWLGPDEWLVLGGERLERDLTDVLTAALEGQHATVNGLGGGQVVMRLAGAAASDLLAAGCTMELHVNAFPVGACAQTGLAKAGVIIGMIDAAPVYELVVRRSFAGYLARWLEQAAQRQGMQLEIR